MTIDPATVQGHWRHAHEEDTDSEMVFVSADQELPPSRGRRELRLEEGGEAEEAGPGPTDVPGAHAARWELGGEDELVIRDQGGHETWRARIASADQNRLVLDKRSVR